LFRKLFLLVDLCIASDRICRAEDDCEDAVKKRAFQIRADLDVPFSILKLTALAGKKLDGDGVSIKFVVNRVSKLCKTMSAIVAKLNENERNRLTLPNVDNILAQKDTFQPPSIHILPAPVHQLKTRSYDEMIERNIGVYSMYSHSHGFDLSLLSGWLKSSHFDNRKDHVSVLLRLKTVERVFLERAKQGITKNFLATSELPMLLAVIDEYRTLFHALEKNAKKASLMTTNLQSRELLVVWIAFSLAFASLTREYPTLMCTVGVPLHVSDLEHLVLSDRDGWDALLQVAMFLSANDHGNDKALFSLQYRKASFDFAESFGRNDKRLQDIWKVESHDAQLRVDAHWTQVVQKQNRARQLRSEIHVLTSELSSAQSQLSDAQHEYNRRSRYSHNRHLSDDVNICQSKVNKIKNKLKQKESELKETLKPPNPVQQPLPKYEGKALQWLFFLHMPKPFRVLSTLSLTAQQMLVPHPWNACCGGIDGLQEVKILEHIKMPMGTCLASFYNENQTYTFHRPIEVRHGEQGDIALTTIDHELLQPKQIGSNSVDYMSNKEDGVCYPDSVNMQIEWRGGKHYFDQSNGVSFDPFKVPSEWVCSYFTERLQDVNENCVQWALLLDQHSQFAPKRGNKPLSCQETRPQWMTRAQFLKFCSVRAYPRNQLRAILTGLLDAEWFLPFDQKSVHTLLKQTLFHVGKIQKTVHSNTLHFEWKQDMFLNDIGFLSAMNFALMAKTTDLKESPSRYHETLLMGIIACFFADWDEKIKDIACELAKAAFAWAKNYGEQASIVTGDEYMNLRIQQRLRLCVSVICLLSGPISKEDVSFALKCQVLAKNVCVANGEEETPLLLTLQSAEILCQECFASKSVAVIFAVETYQSILSDAVQSLLLDFPTTISWKPKGSLPSSCFIASDKEGNVYALNVLTGVLLVNGCPPSSLPAEILEHKLYLQTFGDRNFEVVSKKNGFQTIHNVGDYCYLFDLPDNCNLQVFETGPGGVTLQLLDGTDGQIGKWAPDLPVRLQKMHRYVFITPISYCPTYD